MNDKLNAGRTLLYDFFAGLFLYDLLLGREELLKEQLQILLENPFDDGLEFPISQILLALKTGGIESFCTEYTTIFNLPIARKRVHLLLSHYKEGCVGGQALLDIRQKLRSFPIRMNSDICKESEEHFGFILMLMRFLIENHDQVPPNSEIEVFKEFIKPYGIQIAKELKEHYESKIYSKVGELLESFLEFEESYIK